MYKGGTYGHVPAWSMGPKPKANLGNKVPGPGSYDLPGGFGWKSEPKYSFGKHQKAFRDQGVPGPGAYDANFGFSPKKTALDKDSRFKGPRSGVPGPGTYDSNGGKGAGYSFGRQKREVAVKPGGPDYDIPASIPDVAPYNYPAKDNRKIHL